MAGCLATLINSFLVEILVMMDIPGCSPRLFIACAPSIVDKLAKAVFDIIELTNAMASQADSVNSGVEHSCSIEGQSSIQLNAHRREMRASRASFLSSLTSCSVFVDRFDKMLCYANIDDDWRAGMLESTAQGNYQSFASYVHELTYYLDRCGESYHSFMKSCTDAKKQFDMNISDLTDGSPFALVQAIRPRTENSRRLQSALIAGTGVIGGTGLFTLTRILNIHVNLSVISAPCRCHHCCRCVDSGKTHLNSCESKRRKR